MSSDLSRRGFLRSGLLGGAAVIAGCLGDAAQSSPTAPGTETTEPISDVSVDGSDLVVELVEDHTVSGMNLIGPDGSAFAETEVPVGETTTRIQLLAIKPGLGGYEHYEPGVYELVAIGGSGSSRMEVALEPELRITGVEQYRDGEESTDLGKLAVTVENVGTGPTWVYDITYRDSPNYAANADLISDAGIPQLSVPAEPVESILDPQSRRQYVGTTVPLQFDSDTDVSCQGNSTFIVVVGTAAGESLEARISARIGGERRSVGLLDQFTCSEVAIRETLRGETDG